MATGKRHLTGLLFLLQLVAASQETYRSFSQVDSLTYARYQRQEWKSLVEAGNSALKQGYDYYYLRVRMGVAWFERKNYLRAARHFEEALRLNSGDPLAGEYLYGCYIRMNRPAEALRIYSQLPESARKRLDNTLPKLCQAGIAGGHLFSDQPEKFSPFDLDGPDNYYGETDLTRSAGLVNAGLEWGFRSGISLYGGYTWIRLEKNKRAQENDTLSLDDRYPLNQHQIYLSSSMPLKWGISVSAAFNCVVDDYETIMPAYEEEEDSIIYPPGSYHLTSFIGYFSMARDFRIVRTSLFGAWSNLNERRQIQAGFHLMAFPLGNLSFYSSSRLMDHIVEADHHFIFEQMIGMHVFGPVWAEINATLGEMRDYHEQGASVIYNFADVMRFKGGGKVIWTASPVITVTAEYIFLLREGEYVSYRDQGTGEDPVIGPVIITENFNNHIVVLGINWKF